MPRLDTACVWCGCTELRACPGGCSWRQVDPPVCSTIRCVLHETATTALVAEVTAALSEWAHPTDYRRARLKRAARQLEDLHAAAAAAALEERG